MSVCWRGTSLVRIYAIIELPVRVEDEFIFQIVEFRDLTQAQMMRLNFLRSHEHDIADIEQIDPIVPLFLAFITMILRNSKLIPLRLFIKVAFFLHPLDFFGRHKAHPELLDQVSGDLVLALASILQLILKNDINELLLMLLKLQKHLLNVCLMHGFRFEFISDVVAGLGVALVLAHAVLVLAY